MPFEGLADGTGAGLRCRHALAGAPLPVVEQVIEVGGVVNERVRAEVHRQAGRRRAGAANRGDGAGDGRRERPQTTEGVGRGGGSVPPVGHAGPNDESARRRRLPEAVDAGASALAPDHRHPPAQALRTGKPRRGVGPCLLRGHGQGRSDEGGATSLGKTPVGVGAPDALLYSGQRRAVRRRRVRPDPQPLPDRHDRETRTVTESVEERRIVEPRHPDDADACRNVGQTVDLFRSSDFGDDQCGSGPRVKAKEGFGERAVDLAGGFAGGIERGSRAAQRPHERGAEHRAIGNEPGARGEERGAVERPHVERRGERERGVGTHGRLRSTRHEVSRASGGASPRSVSGLKNRA